ncbi:MAG: heavy metal transporter [Bacteroidetes bacterium MedPE-SWsnd-G2]|nr:MAG: heavy metal transporter [Bacteroidetes bacterium MedPE-SWsnd-G2]
MRETFKVQNLKCNGCASTITTKLESQNGLSNIMVDSVTKEVAFDAENELAASNAKAVLFKIGYPLEGEDNPFLTKAKSYVSCAIGKSNS